MLTRRRFLKALGAGGLLAAGSAGWLVALRGCAPSVAGLSCLSEHEHRTLTALAVAHFPEGGAFAAGAASRDLARTFDAYLADEDDDRQADLKRALLLLEYGPLVYDHRAVTFSHLSAEERLALRVSRKTVERLMREKGIVGRQKRRFRHTTDSNHTNPIAPNVVQRNFEPDATNQVWAGDVTYIATSEGWAYLAVLIDLCSRRAVGWAISATNDTNLALAALEHAVRARGIVPGLELKAQVAAIAA